MRDKFRHYAPVFGHLLYFVSVRGVICGLCFCLLTSVIQGAGLVMYRRLKISYYNNMDIEKYKLLTTQPFSVYMPCILCALTLVWNLPGISICSMTLNLSCNTTLPRFPRMSKSIYDKDLETQTVNREWLFVVSRSLWVSSSTSHKYSANQLSAADFELMKIYAV